MTQTARAIPELSIDTQTLERLLKTCAIGDVVTYAALSDAIGRDVQNGARHILVSAERRVQREQMVFEPVRNVGVKRLDDAAIVGTTAGTMDRVRNLARRQRRKLECVQDFDALPNELKLKHNVAVSVFGILGHITSDRQVKKLESKMTAQQHDALPMAKFLDAMRDSL